MVHVRNVTSLPPPPPPPPPPTIAIPASSVAGQVPLLLANV